MLDRFSPRGGGSEQWSFGFARFLAGQGHEVHVVAFDADEDHGLKLTLHRLPHAADPIRRARRAARVIDALRPDAVHDTGTGWSADVFHPLTGSRPLAQERLAALHPPLLGPRAAWSPLSVLRRQRMAQLERRQLRDATRIVAVSRMVAGHLAARFGVADDRMQVIHNGVDVARFASSRLDPLRLETREMLHAIGTTLYLISAHDLRLQGVDTALRALARVRASGADVRAVVAGGAAGPDWLELAGSLGVRRRVAFLGEVGDMPRLYAAADVLVHATRWDACSLSTLEAGAAGLPVITTAMDGAAELIGDGRTGFVLPDPGDVVALADRMTRLLDPDLRLRIGDAARAAAPAHDNVRNYKAVAAVLREAARERRAEARRR